MLSPTPCWGHLGSRLQEARIGARNDNHWSVSPGDFGLPSDDAPFRSGFAPASAHNPWLLVPKLFDDDLHSFGLPLLQPSRGFKRHSAVVDRKRPSDGAPGCDLCQFCAEVPAI